MLAYGKENGNGVYCLENLVNGKSYINGSSDLQQTAIDLARALNNGIHRNKELQKDWKAMGEDCFLFYCLEKADKFLTREKVELYRTIMNSYSKGYNTDSDNVKGFCFTDETRKKISDSLKGRRPVSVNTRGNPNQDSASRIKNRMSQKKRFNSNKEKIWIKRGCKPFICNETGKVYLSTVDAARELGIANNIWKALNGKVKQLCGFTFRYCQPDEDIVELRPTVGKPPRGKNREKSS